MKLNAKERQFFVDFAGSREDLLGAVNDALRERNVKLTSQQKAIKTKMYVKAVARLLNMTIDELTCRAVASCGLDVNVDDELTNSVEKNPIKRTILHLFQHCQASHICW